jgi:hypothetical protein
MKLTKLSLIAAMFIGSSAFAIENTKVSGDVKVYYGTTDSDSGSGWYAESGNDVSMFDSKGSYANVAVDLGLTTDLTEDVSAGAKATYVTTLGLENNLVDNTWSNSHDVKANSAADFAEDQQLNDAMYIGELWVAGTVFDTTIKAGRQALYTPLVYTETWGIDANTFEAVVAINQTLSDTTIIAAYIGKSNGSADDAATGLTLRDNALPGATQAGYVSQDGTFNTFGSNGVYTAGLINNSFNPLTVSAWYYSLQQMAEAVWVQADLNVEGILAGVQYTQIDTTKLTSTNKDDEAFGVMLGYAAEDVATLKLAYSSVDDQGTIGVANIATGSRTNGDGAQSKLYTEMWWAYGNVSQTGADSYSLTVERTVEGVDLLAGYYYADIDPNGATANEAEVTEIALTASKSFGPLDTSLALIFDDVEDVDAPANDVKTTSLQVYLAYNF